MELAFRHTKMQMHMRRICSSPAQTLGPLHHARRLPSSSRRFPRTGDSDSCSAAADSSRFGLSRACRGGGWRVCLETRGKNNGIQNQPVQQIALASTLPSNSENISFADGLMVSFELWKFTFNELRIATRNFRPESLLGEGGFGRVYKGWIGENRTAPGRPGTGLTVAVKTLNSDGQQGHKELVAEANFLGNLKHPNLVKLIGYCLEDNQRGLVHEFMPRGSLEHHLFRTSYDDGSS